MVPLATEIITGSVGEMSAAPKAGDSLTAATGAGSFVVDGALEELLSLLPDPADDEPADELAAAGLTPATPDWVGSAVDDDGEQAAVTTSRPAAKSASAARRAGLEECSCIWSSGNRQLAPARSATDVLIW
jgi:hypothetical protein